MTTATRTACYECGHNQDVHHETSCDLCKACKGFVYTETMTIDLSPPTAMYSPHVRVLKDFFEDLTRRLIETKETKDTDYRATVVWLDGQIGSIRKAMSDVLTDDFLLIVDGKRFPGGPRQDR